MEKSKVVANKNLPKRYPLVFTLLILHLADYYNAPSWAWGAIMTFLALYWLAVILTKVNESQYNIFKDESLEPKKSKFIDKLQEKMTEKSG
jgi:hypothetical protein